MEHNTENSKRNGMEMKSWRKRQEIITTGPHMYSCLLNPMGAGRHRPLPHAAENLHIKFDSPKTWLHSYPWVSDGDWFQEPPWIKNLWMLKSPVWNAVDKCLLSAICSCELPTADETNTSIHFLFMHAWTWPVQTHVIRWSAVHKWFPWRWESK